MSDYNYVWLGCWDAQFVADTAIYFFILINREQSLSLAHRLTRECLVSSVLLNSSWAAAVPVCSLYAAILNKFNPQTSEDMALKEKDLDIVGEIDFL